MLFFKYHFNTETAARKHIFYRLKGVLSYTGKLLIAALVVGAAMAVVHDALVETASAKLLREENALIRKHTTELEQQVSYAELTLQRLKNIDKTLNDRLFNSGPSTNAETTSTLSKQRVLLAGVADFQYMMDLLSRRSIQLTEKSSRTNAVFGANIRISKDQIETLQSIPTIQPVENSQLDLLVSGFGERINPFHKGKYNHTGLDFAAPRGSAVFATAPGKVMRIKKTSLQAGYGNYIDIDHGNGFVTRYAHLDDISIRRGQSVYKGKVIATIGSSGGSIAPHLHYEVMHEGEPVNPVNYLLEGLTSNQYGSLLLQAAEKNQSLD